MSSVDFVILTDKENFPQYNNAGQEQNAFIEDEFLLKALEQEGFNAIRLPWDDPQFKWSDVNGVIFRSTWDYF